MDKSVNSVFAQMGVDVGPKKVKETAVDLGLPEKTPNMPEDGSIALGVATASTLDMAEAYATLANHGKHGHYRLVEKATRGGEVIDLPDREAEQAVAAGRGRLHHGRTAQASSRAAPAPRRSRAGRPAAGKTGTAEEDKAAWFAGLHTRTGHRHQRDGPELRDRRAEAAVRGRRTGARQRRRLPRGDLGRLHEGGARGPARHATSTSTRTAGADIPSGSPTAPGTSEPPSDPSSEPPTSGPSRLRPATATTPSTPPERASDGPGHTADGRRDRGRARAARSAGRSAARTAAGRAATRPESPPPPVRR